MDDYVIHLDRESFHPDRIITPAYQTVFLMSLTGRHTPYKKLVLLFFQGLRQFSELGQLDGAGLEVRTSWLPAHGYVEGGEACSLLSQLT